MEEARKRCDALPAPLAPHPRPSRNSPVIQPFRIALRRACARSRAFSVVAPAVLACALASAPAMATVTSQGNVTPSPNPGNPGGGNVAGPLFVGDSTLGQL